MAFGRAEKHLHRISTRRDCALSAFEIWGNRAVDHVVATLNLGEDCGGVGHLRHKTRMHKRTNFD